MNSSKINPPQRLLMGPGPINADPRVLQAMGAPLLGQFDPQFREYMKADLGALPRRVPDAEPLDAAGRRHARAPAIEAALVSLIEPGDRVLVPVFGRFGHLKVEIAKRCGAEVRAIEVEWGTRISRRAVSSARSGRSSPKLVALSHGDTSTTMAQPLPSSAICAARHDAHPVRRCDRHARRHGPAGRRLADRRGQRRTAEMPRRAAGQRAAHAERARGENEFREESIPKQGLREKDQQEGDGPVIRSNYFDLAMIMDYWSDKALNHHTEATTMLYAAHECAPHPAEEGLQNAFARHARPRKR